MLAAATIQGQRLFCSKLPIMWLLFEGGENSKKYGKCVAVTSIEYYLVVSIICNYMWYHTSL